MSNSDQSNPQPVSLHLSAETVGGTRGLGRQVEAHGLGAGDGLGAGAAARSAEMRRAPRTARATDVSVGLHAVGVGMTPLPATNSPGTPQTSLSGEHTLVPSSSSPMRVLP